MSLWRLGKKTNSKQVSLEHRYNLFSWQSLIPVPKQTKAVQPQKQFKALFHPLLYLLLHPSSAKRSRNSSKKLPWRLTSNISNLPTGGCIFTQHPTFKKPRHHHINFKLHLLLLILSFLETGGLHRPEWRQLWGKCVSHLAFSDECLRQSRQLNGFEWHWCFAGQLKAKEQRSTTPSHGTNISSSHEGKTLPFVVTTKESRKSIAWATLGVPFSGVNDFIPWKSQYQFKK